MNPLADFLIPIVSGFASAPPHAGRLSRERAAALRASLSDLAQARALADLESRNYVVRGGL